MPLETAVTLGVLVAVTVALAFEFLTPDALLLASLAALVLAGIIDLETAFAGFSNLTLVAIGSLYVVAAALRNVGALDRASNLLFGRRNRGATLTLLRMTPIVATASAFLNNTPVVAMGIPVTRAWARRNRAKVSRLLMPLSFASIVGGLCTVIGTSTNLVADGLLRDRGLAGIGFFELASIGLPCALVALVYIVFLAPVLLPVREDVRIAEEQERSRLLEVDVPPESPLIGRTIADLELTGLPGLDLQRIERGERTLGPVGDEERVATGDRLLYSGGGRPGDKAVVGGEETILKAPDERPTSAEAPIASSIVDAAGGFGPVGLLGGLVVATMITTGVITNNAAIALLLPVALSVAESQPTLDARGLVLAVTITASLALWTPLGYQTNLMVYGPGNYRFTDFVRFGFPLQVLLAVVIVGVVTLSWTG